MQMSKAYLRLEEATEISTSGISVRAAIEDLSDKVSLTYYRLLEGLPVRFTLTRPGEDKRSIILKYRSEIHAVYAQTVGWTLTVRVEVQEECTTISLGDALSQIAEEVDPIRSYREAEIGIGLDNQ